MSFDLYKRNLFSRGIVQRRKAAQQNRLVKEPQKTKAYRRTKGGPAKMPESVSLRSKVVEIYDQGQTSSCTAQAVCAAIEILDKDPVWKPSRRYVYYWTRRYEGGPMVDEGAYMDDGLKCLTERGVCEEKNCPFDSSLINVEPAKGCDEDAATHKIADIQDLDTRDPGILLNMIRSELSQGFPVLVGIDLYDSFFSSDASKTGKIPVPDPKTENNLGGHEVLIVGYTPTHLEFLNSWSSSWGDSGFGWAPIEYMTNPNFASTFRAFQRLIIQETDNGTRTYVVDPTTITADIPIKCTGCVIL